MIRLIDVIEALKKKGRNDDAKLCELIFTELLDMTYGIDRDEVMKMTIDGIEQALSPDNLEQVLSLPSKPSGWDNFHWGKSAFVRDSS